MARESKLQFDENTYRLFLHHTDQKIIACRHILNHIKKGGIVKSKRSIESWRFLDIGTGSGELTVPILRYLNAKLSYFLEAVLIEPQAGLRKILVSKLSTSFHSKIRIVEGKLEDFLGSTHEQFNFILCSHAFYHIGEWAKNLKKLLTLSTPTGRACIILASREGLTPLLGQDYLSFEKGYAEDMEEIIKKQGIHFKKEKVVSSLYLNYGNAGSNARILLSFFNNFTLNYPKLAELEKRTMELKGITNPGYVRLIDYFFWIHK